MTVVMGAGTADMMFCGEETYKKYKQQEAFLSWKEILGDDYSKYEEYMTDDGRLDLENVQTGRNTIWFITARSMQW